MKTYNIKVNGNAFEVKIDSIDENGIASVSVNGKDYKVEIGSECLPARASDAPATSPAAPAAVRATAPAAPAATPQGAPAGGCDVLATLPGVIVGINVNLGDSVNEGQAVATLEAMKMENAIEAECSGVIKAIYVQKGDSVLEGAKIVTIG